MTKKTQKLRKVLTLAACAVLLVCVTIVGTVAYLTSNDAVTNTFTVGNVQIKLDETDTDDDTLTSDNDNGRDKANAYKLLPNQTYTKDPIVWVDENSENCYVYIKVVNQLADLEEDGDAANKPTIDAQIKANGWTVLDSAQIEGATVYYKNVKVSELVGTTNVTKEGYKGIATFAEIYVDSEASNEEDATLKIADFANKTIEVTAYAIQSAGFQNEADAWDAVYAEYNN